MTQMQQKAATDRCLWLLDETKLILVQTMPSSVRTIDGKSSYMQVDLGAVCDVNSVTVSLLGRW